MTYTIKQLADLAGVSVRTLQHYDKIGLLSPAERGKNNYRYYTSAEVLRLQQILFFRELDFSLEDIQRIIDSPYYSVESALEDQKVILLAERKRINTLLGTIKLQLNSMKDNHKIDDQFRLAGFSDDDIAAMKQEIHQKYDPRLVEQSFNRVSQWSKAELKTVQAEGLGIVKSIAKEMVAGPQSPAVQKLIADYHAHMNRFYDCSPDIFAGLGDMYVADPRFTKYYEDVATGLAMFMRDAMHYYVQQQRD